jgi:hypothetical protein
MGVMWLGTSEICRGGLWLGELEPDTVGSIGGIRVEGEGRGREAQLFALV